MSLCLHKLRYKSCCMIANIHILNLKDRIESMRFPMYVACNQLKKCKAKEEKWMNLSHRFIPNPKSQKPFKKYETS